MPGLSSAPQSTQPLNFVTPQNLPPLPVNPQPVPQYTTASFFVPTTPSPKNSVSSNSSFEVTQISHNQFKPISPPPPSLQNNYTIPQPVVPVPVQPIATTQSLFVNFNPPISLTNSTNLVQPVYSGAFSGNILSPVMDAIPPNELTRGSNLNSANVNTVTSMSNPATVAQVNVSICSSKIGFLLTEYFLAPGKSGVQARVSPLVFPERFRM